MFLEECVSKKIISLEQIKKVDDPQIIPFIICDYFIYLNLKNRVFENFFNYFPIFNKFKSNLYLSSSDDEKYLLFHYQKIVDFIISNKLNISSIGNIVYNKYNEDDFESFVRFLKACFIIGVMKSGNATFP